MSTIVVSHAYNTDERSVWYPYLRDQLQLRGHTVDVPNLPDAHAPGLEQWQTAFAERALAAPAEETVLVGHSIGAVNILRFLERYDPDRGGAFAGAVLVAAPAYEVGYEALVEFFAKPFDWGAIRRTAQRFHVLAAADDPVLIPDPFGHVAALVTNLRATATITPTGGHFGATPDDHIDLPEAVRLVLDTLGTR
ncbi:RBBP9/YdeN family alpha/beta hydrolase [Streptomyces sp. NPDC127033]|uniref:RBBP9/YdeN family alpha/beta hydrolase n=1 Tax=Streptomyces sp. NPDC127033 TaxID=3347110 RepID=UPI003660FE6F